MYTIIRPERAATSRGDLASSRSLFSRDNLSQILGSRRYVGSGGISRLPMPERAAASRGDLASSRSLFSRDNLSQIVGSRRYVGSGGISRLPMPERAATSRGDLASSRSLFSRDNLSQILGSRRIVGSSSSGATRTGVVPTSTLVPRAIEGIPGFPNTYYQGPSAPSTAGLFGGLPGGLGTAALPQAGGLGAALLPGGGGGGAPLPPSGGGMGTEQLPGGGGEGTLSLGSIGGGMSDVGSGIMDTIKEYIPLAIKVILAIIVIKIVLWLIRGRK